MAATLRERRRQETREAILTASRRLLAEEGQVGLSLRAVAREVGIAVSALYRYVPSRDHLITELLSEAFEQHADAVDAAIDHALATNPAPTRTVVAALRAGAVAYRRWALDHPVQFGLAHGAPLPGYAAPSDRTVAAAARPGDRFTALVGTAYDAGMIDLVAVTARAARLGPETAAHFAELATRRGYRLPTPLLALVIDGFVRLQGFTVMETFGQIRPFTTQPDLYFDDTLDDVLHAIGLPRE